MLVDREKNVSLSLIQLEDCYSRIGEAISNRRAESQPCLPLSTFRKLLESLSLLLYKMMTCQRLSELLQLLPYARHCGRWWTMISAVKNHQPY